jgi:hypothetical protein
MVPRVPYILQEPLDRLCLIVSRNKVPRVPYILQEPLDRFCLIVSRNKEPRVPPVRRTQRQVLPYIHDEKGTRILTLSGNRGRFFNSSYESLEDRDLLTDGRNRGRFFNTG